jgi:hypothetical protein
MGRFTNRTRFSWRGKNHRIEITPHIKAIGGMKSTVGWDHCPGQLLVRDNGPKLRLVDLNLPLA